MAPWRERAADPSATQALEKKGLPRILARILASRGFLDPALSRLADATSLPGVSDAVNTIIEFVASRRKIVVFGDYDADGVCATAILVRTIRILGGVADAFIPERFTEGYGMTDASLSRLFSEHPDMALVVTVDNGIIICLAPSCQCQTLSSIHELHPRLAARTSAARASPSFSPPRSRRRPRIAESTTAASSPVRC